MLTETSSTGLQPAPFDHAIAEGPDGVEAWWVTAADGPRLRMAVWPRGTKGTVLMFPGRTEYVEKYGRVAETFAQAGYGMVALDWRGQGLSDRPAHNRGMGHVTSFDEYRRDVTIFRATLATLDLPGPHYLVGHSMGGCIGLRALYDGLPVAAAAFTGPMWGLQMSPFLQKITPAVMALATPLRLGKRFAPTMGEWTPMPFEDNTLTTDRDQFDYMTRQTDVHPELALGGPSLSWVKQAIVETTRLMNLPPLDLPLLAVIGSNERIVAIEAVEQRLATWPGGIHITVDGGQHEVLMESPPRRQQTFDAILDLFAAHPA